MRVVLDTNVLISALIFGGVPRRILELAIAGAYDVAISDAILDELQGVLCSKKFHYPLEVAAAIANELRIICEVARPTTVLAVVKDDPADNAILECAVQAEADYLVSGDDHLLALKEYNKTRIVSPARFVELHEGE